LNLFQRSSKSAVSERRNLERLRLYSTAMVLWSGDGAWVRMQATLDATYAEVEDFLGDQVAAEGAATVVDVGCGTGATTLAIARRLGRDSRCTGVDVSEQMVALARERAASEDSTVEFVVADAQRTASPPAPPT
jgi:cyclopropane fatty-acyl-phospholipid synthase-like methyltransferase